MHIFSDTVLEEKLATESYFNGINTLLMKIIILLTRWNVKNVFQFLQKWIYHNDDTKQKM